MSLGTEIEDHCCTRHEASADEYRGPASAASSFGIATPELLTDAHGSGGANAEGHHVRESCAIQGDFVASERQRSEFRAERCGCRKSPDFQKYLHGGGNSQLQ